MMRAFPPAETGENAAWRVPALPKIHEDSIAVKGVKMKLLVIAPAGASTR